MNDKVIPLRSLDAPITRNLSEMLLVLADLDDALVSIDYCRDTTSDPRLHKPLLRDLIVQVAACFDRASPLDFEAIFGTSDSGAGDYLKWIRDMRDSYGAHRHGAARQCAVGLMIEPATGAVLGEGHAFQTFDGLSAEEWPPMRNFVQVARDFAQQRCEALLGEFLNAAEQLSPTDRLQLPTAKTFGLDPSEMRMSRGEVARRKGRGTPVASPPCD